MECGDSIFEEIQNGIKLAKYLVVVLSPDSVASSWVRQELHAGFSRELVEKRVVVVPILYKRCDVPLLIKDKLYADFTESYDVGFRDLLKRLAPDAAEALGKC